MMEFDSACWRLSYCIIIAATKCLLLKLSPLAIQMKFESQSDELGVDALTVFGYSTSTVSKLPNSTVLEHQNSTESQKTLASTFGERGEMETFTARVKKSANSWSSTQLTAHR